MPELADLPVLDGSTHRFCGSCPADLVTRRWLAGVTGGSAGWWGEENGSPHLACRLVGGRGRLLAWAGDNETWSIDVRGHLHMSLFTSNRTCRAFVKPGLYASS
jgi:hypothetical protein